jgi:hypothetical protein
MDPNNLDLATEADFEAWPNSHWQLAQLLSNASLQNDTFTVDEKVKDGTITYKLPLNDFLGIENKLPTKGTGFYESPCTRNIHQDESDPFTVGFEVRSHSDADDWTAGTCNLRQHLRMKHGVLFGGDAAPTMLVKKKDADGTGKPSYKVSASQTEAFVAYDEKEEAQWEEAIQVQQQKACESHPDHEIVHAGRPTGQIVVNGLFGDGAKVGKFISLLMDGGIPTPGRRSIAKTQRAMSISGARSTSMT